MTTNHVSPSAPRSNWKMVLLAIAAVIVIFLNYVLQAVPDQSPGKAPVLAGAPPIASVLERGEYLTRAADCAACHTTPGGRPFAGGVPFNLPFGTIYSPNITADAKTGIGKWTDNDFVRALHDGVNADGQRMYPAFPYTSYTGLSREDALAIKAYIFSLAKVEQPNISSTLSFPFNQRWTMAFWNFAFFKGGRFESDPNQSADWNRGAYLARVLGHCGECHTPRNFAFATKSSEELAGAPLEGWLAVNITPDKTHGIGSWSDADLETYLGTGHAPNHGSAGGPMAEAVENSLQYLGPQDLASLVVYLRSVPARPNGRATAEGTAATPAATATTEAPGREFHTKNALGQRLFADACASCHTWNGQGRETPYAALLGSRNVGDVEGHNVTQMILKGIHMNVRGQEVMMPAFGRSYTDAEVAALSNYVIELHSGRTGSVRPEDVALRRQGK